MYSELRITNSPLLDEKQERMAVKLARTLRNRPELGDFCHRVTMAYFRVNTVKEQPILDEQWYLAARILSYLPNVEKLGIHLSPAGTRYIWDQLLLGTAGMKRLTKVDLGGFNAESELAQIFTSNWGSSVKELSLESHVFIYDCTDHGRKLIDPDVSNDNPTSDTTSSKYKQRGF